MLLTIFEMRSFIAVINGMHVCLGCTIINIRLMVLIKRLSCLEKVKSFINDRKYGGDDPDAAQIRQKAYENSMLVTFIFMLNIFYQTISLPISGMGGGEPMQFPFNLESLPELKRQAIKQLYALFWIPYVYLAANNFLSIYLTLVGLRAEMKITVDSFEKIFETANVKLEMEANERRQNPREERYWELLQKELAQCVEHHSEVLKQLENFKTITNISFLILYYMTMLFIGFGILIAFFYPVFDAFILISIDYTMRYVIECYVLCRLVATFNDTQRNIAHALYGNDWIRKLKFSPKFAQEYKKVRLTFLIVMAQSQQSLKIKCGNIFELSMGKFTRLINAYYTIVIFLYNFVRNARF
ncbi:uncharacterized protein LOC129741147 [Uranotaenia lowii]|uniref:uncharacterized protein LOC129741147 n=1 Tax=Uranotaenia lowii TaxID=190385 RepID=UPI002478E014|nr:uncharacterized protein LOC129741147 [Uranotaenia lowii]